MDLRRSCPTHAWVGFKHDISTEFDKKGTYNIFDTFLTSKLVAVKPKRLQHAQGSKLLGDASCNIMVLGNGKGSILAPFFFWIIDLRRSCPAHALAGHIFENSLVKLTVLLYPVCILPLP